jgi:hypothetical protein
MLTVRDDNGLPDERSIQIQVTPDRPEATSQNVSTLQNQTINIFLTGNDQLGQPLTFFIVSTPSHGSLGAVTPVRQISANVTYTPRPGFVGVDSFTFKANNGRMDSDPATVSITVEPVPVLPVFVGPSPVFQGVFALGVSSSATGSLYFAIHLTPQQPVNVTVVMANGDSVLGVGFFLGSFPPLAQYTLNSTLLRVSFVLSNSTPGFSAGDCLPDHRRAAIAFGPPR